MELNVYSIDGKATGSVVSIPSNVFGIEPNDHAIYLDVKQYLANQRQGTHKAKERSELSGSTRKLKKQKGTGGARAGDINNPQFRGGARVFGPRPRDYGFKLNKKLKALARKSALTYKAQANSIFVIEDRGFSDHKTKNMVSLLKNLNLSNKKVLVLTGSIDKNMVLSARNLEKANVMVASNVSTYALMNANVLVISESAIKSIEQTLN
jgi:large subunit ribosomal protein L4